MHKAGLRDGRIRRYPEFAWLGKVTDVASTAFKVINWGKEFEHFYDVVTRLKNDPTFTADVFYGLPCFYSETKFANHCVKVYKQLRKDFPGLIMTLEETQLEKAGGDARDRQKANDAAGIMNQLANRKMVLRLSGMCDVYETFGHGVNVLQIPAYHADIEELNATGKYRGILLIDDHPEQNRTRHGSFLAQTESLENVTSAVSNNLQKLARRLSNELKEHVFDEKTLEVIKITRPLVDLQTLTLKVRARGVPLITTLESNIFIKNAKEIASNIRCVPDSEMRLQYREFLSRMQNSTSDIPDSGLKSLDILKMFLQSSKKLYKGIEMIVHVLSVASVAMTVESVVESHVSVYENRINKNRNFTEQRASQEMCIALNGPNIAQSDSVVKAAMSRYWQQESANEDFWHFIRRSDNITQYFVSKVVDRISKNTSNLPFMDK
eukprot:Seg2973.2 transcript_id=Seg2973.2/GoldUCD/mRNA.D3Y31 product="hypothetical protein" protein_id=Seg2973.2/GoldUCD/D3Y31